MQEQQAEIRTLKEMVQQLTLLVMKDKVDTTWLDEDTAAEMLGYAPRTLRLQVKKGAIPVDYRNTKGRNWQYSRKQLLNYKRDTSTAA